jgi:hypothetical protein
MGEEGTARAGLPEAESQTGQRVPQTEQILLARLDHHVGIGHWNRLSVQPQRRAPDQQEGHTLRGQDRGGQHRHRLVEQSLAGTHLSHPRPGRLVRCTSVCPRAHDVPQ